MEGETSVVDRTESNEEKFENFKSEKDSIDDELASTSESVVNDLNLKEEEHEDLWQKEIEGDVRIEMMRMTKQDYLNLCSQFQNGLKTLLADEQTSLYATFSVFFKRFRFTYVDSRQLLSKVCELEVMKRYLESKKEELSERLDQRDAEERDLRHSYMTIRNAIAETSKQKNEIEQERDELKKKLAQIPEEILQACLDSSVMTASEEKQLLQSRLEAMSDQMEQLSEDLKYAQKREDLFRGKYQVVRVIQASLREEILSYKRELRFATQMKEKAELVVAEKNAIIERNSATIQELRSNIPKLEKEIKARKSMNSQTNRELQLTKKSLTESQRAVRRLTNELTSRQFQLAVMKAQISNLEMSMTKNKTHVHSLKTEISKMTKQRNQIFKNFRIMDEDFKRTKADYEKIAQTVRQQVGLIEFHQREKQLVEVDYKDAMKQLMKATYEIRQEKRVIKKLQSDIKILEINKESLCKDLDAKISQIEDLKTAAERSRIEKNTMAKEVRDQVILIQDLQNKIKTLEQRCAEYDCKIQHLKEQVRDEQGKYKFLTDVHRDVTNEYRNTKRELENTKYLNSVVAKRNKSQIVHIRGLEEHQEKLEKQITQLKVDIKSVRSSEAQKVAENSQLTEELSQKEREKLCISKVVSDKELELVAIRREAKNFASELGVLRTQLDEKLNELNIKDRKIRDQQKDFIRVEQMLQNRISDIKLLKTEIQNLRRTEAVLRSQKTDTDNLRAEISNVHRQLIDEKLKSKTMEEEFQNPQNVHRWRILEAEDPTRAHLIARNLKFQKDLVEKTDKLKDKEQELQDKNLLLVELQQNLKKVSESKSDGNTWPLKVEIRKYKERIKCLTGEIAMYSDLTTKQESMIKGLRSEISRLKVSAYEKNLPPITVKA